MGEEYVDDIEDLIFKKENGEWVACFHTDAGNLRFPSLNGRDLLCKVDFCPWCGKKLDKDAKGHTH